MNNFSSRSIVFEVFFLLQTQFCLILSWPLQQISNLLYGFSFDKSLPNRILSESEPQAQLFLSCAASDSLYFRTGSFLSRKKKEEIYTDGCNLKKNLSSQSNMNTFYVHEYALIPPCYAILLFDDLIWFELYVRKVLFIPYSKYAIKMRKDFLDMQ